MPECNNIVYQFHMLYINESRRDTSTYVNIPPLSIHWLLVYYRT